MVALTANRDTPERAGVDLVRGVAATTTIFKGSLVALNAAGDLVPASVATTQIADGRAEESVVGNATAGDIKCRVKAGVFRWANSAAGDAITKAHIGDNCHIVDDQTVALTDGASTRSVAGRIVDVDPQGVWVKTGIAI